MCVGLGELPYYVRRRCDEERGCKGPHVKIVDRAKGWILETELGREVVGVGISWQFRKDVVGDEQVPEDRMVRGHRLFERSVIVLYERFGKGSIEELTRPRRWSFWKYERILYNL